MSDAVQVQLEYTPNPDSLKYSVNRSLLAKGAKNFNSFDEANGVSGLAEKLLSFEDVSSVMLGTNFVTLNLKSQDNIGELNEKILETMRVYIESGQPVIDPKALSEADASEDLSSLSEAERKIVQVLDEEVRPAVAMDGGDITFEKFEDGFVYLKMQGACSGCPSSLMTLKMGVETRLKDAVPEIKEVIPV